MEAIDLAHSLLTDNAEHGRARTDIDGQCLMRAKMNMLSGTLLAVTGVASPSFAARAYPSSLASSAASRSAASSLALLLQPSCPHYDACVAASTRMCLPSLGADR